MTSNLSHDAALAATVALAPIETVAAQLDIPSSALEPYGRFKAKIDRVFLQKLPPRQTTKLILVTAINPTAAGEGKTTTTIGLGDGLRTIGKRVAICLREPSLGPCFGMKGGATGGGRAQVAPAADINFHFTGDFHAITAAHNLLAALIDNHIHWGTHPRLDPAKITWRRVMDMNDRALRATIVGLNGNGPTREDGFDITVASEVMAIFCLARDLDDLQDRLGRMIIGVDLDGQPVTAKQLNAAGAMTALLAQAFAPNLVQTLEGTPALIHGGPFANIAHGCNSLLATGAALRLADYVVTEAGFGADLGAEKFCDIKCRIGNLRPDVAVLVATVRALKLQGGADKNRLDDPDADALTRGLPNLLRHIENLRQFGLPVIVAINAFAADRAEDYVQIKAACAAMGAEAHICRHWAEGGMGTTELAHAVVHATNGPTPAFAPLYDDMMPLATKIETVARQIYRADRVTFSPTATKKLAAFTRAGHAHLPICMAKTPHSFTADPSIHGAPVGFELPIRDVRLAAGAGFVVALCGDIMTMPGLPRVPAATEIGVDATGRITGL